MPWRDSSDGISNTFSIIPDALGKSGETFVSLSDFDIELDPSQLPNSNTNFACSEPNVTIRKRINVFHTYRTAFTGTDTSVNLG